MNGEQFLQLESIRRKEPEPFCIRSFEFTKESKPRTLLYGYYTDRSDLHVYLHNRHVYKTLDNNNMTRWFTSLNELVPDKRLYPEACDYDFCVYLKRRGVVLPFTTFSNTRTPQQFYGKVPHLELSIRV